MSQIPIRLQNFIPISSGVFVIHTPVRLYLSRSSAQLC